MKLKENPLFPILMRSFSENLCIVKKYSLILDYVTVHKPGKTYLKTHLLSASRVLTF